MTANSNLPVSVGPPPQQGKQLPAAQNTSVPSSPVAWMTDETKQFCEFAVQSGFFKEAGVTNIAQAIMKVGYGQQLGLDPMSSLNWLYIVKGKVAMEANAIADAIANHPLYGFDVVELNDQHCIVQITFDGKSKGDPVSFTWDQACAMGVAGNRQWKVDRQLMMFYKAISRAYKLYARDVFKMTIQSKQDMDDELFIDATSDAATQAVATAGTRRRRQDPSAAKDISDAEIVTESSEKPAEGTPIPNQPAVADAPKQSVQSEKTDATASPADQQAQSPEARKVTTQEVQNGVAAVRSSGWTTMNLTPIAKERYQVAPLINLTTAQFADLIAWASDNKPAK